MKMSQSEFRRLLREESGLPEGIRGVRYGHAPVEFVRIASRIDDPVKEWFVSSGLFDEICSSAPANDSDVTRRDLQRLLQLTSSATPDDVTFARHVEDVSNLAQAFLDVLDSAGHHEDMGDFFRIESQCECLLYSLKDAINRPRPYQLAAEYGVPLYPLIRTDAMTASYPSGHALAGYMMSEYYARVYPDCKVELRSLGKRIAESRELVGIHYPSDTEVSRMIARVIIDNDLLRS